MVYKQAADKAGTGACMRREGPRRRRGAFSMEFSSRMLPRILRDVNDGVIVLDGLGVLYRRQNTIWGLCNPHYVLGMALVFLGFA